MILPLVGFRFTNAEFRPPKAIHFICQIEASTMTAVVIYSVSSPVDDDNNAVVVDHQPLKMMQLHRERNKSIYLLARIYVLKHYINHIVENVRENLELIFCKPDDPIEWSMYAVNHPMDARQFYTRHSPWFDLAEMRRKHLKLGDRDSPLSLAHLSPNPAIDGWWWWTRWHK